MNKILIYSAFFVHLLHFGASAQGEQINLSSQKDSISFALGVESALGLFREEAKFEALNKVLLVQGFQSNLSNSPAEDCHGSIQKLLGPHGQDFDTTYLKEGSTCIGQISGYYFYQQIEVLGQIENINLKLVNKGFKQGIFNEHEQNLSAQERTALMEEFAQLTQNYFFKKLEENDERFWKKVLSIDGVEQIGETGIYFETIEPGSGGKPSMESDIEANYILTNAVGDTLESTFQLQQSLKINLGSVIEGWKQGFPSLEKGGKYRLFVPYEKAYKGSNPNSPQGALCFYVEFIDFGPKGSIAAPMHTFERIDD